MRNKRYPGWLLILLLAGFTAYQVASAQSNNLTGLIIDFGDGNPVTYCLDTAGENLAGYDLLIRTNLPVAANHTSQGAAVCKIGEIGCPVENCFCDSPPNYWSYWHLQDGQWVYATAGASTYQIQPGSVDAWVWGDGSPPEVTTLEQICNNTEAIRPQESIHAGQTKLAMLTASSDLSNYLVFGILASLLGAGLIWMVFRR